MGEENILYIFLLKKSDLKKNKEVDSTHTGDKHEEGLEKEFYLDKKQ